MSKSLAWQASVSRSCWRDTCVQPPYTPHAGGWAGSLLPSRASCLLSASTAAKARAVLGRGASQRAGRRQPVPRPAPFESLRQPYPLPNCHLTVYATLPPFVCESCFAHAHSLHLSLPSVTPFAHQPLNTYFPGLYSYTYTTFIHWCPLLLFILTSPSWHTPSHINTLGCPLGISPPVLKPGSLFAHFFVHMYSCTLLALWFLVSLHPANHRSRLICTLKHALSTPDLASRCTPTCTLSVCAGT